MRKIIEIVAGYQRDISQYIDLSKIKIIRLWTIYDEEKMWQSYPKFNSMTGEKLPIKEITIDDLELIHHQGVFIEDQTHDWSIRNNTLNYYSRVVKADSKVKILIEYENLE